MPVLESKPTKRYRLRKPGGRRARTTAPGRNGAPLPGWDELAARNERRPDRRGSTFLAHVSTARFALLILVVAAAVTLYVGHVQATQELLAEVQQQRRDNLRYHLKYNRLKGDFDRMTGPATIYERARALGLVEDIHYGPTIEAE